MVHKSSSLLRNVVIKFCGKSVNGSNKKFVIEQLQKDKYEEFFDFYINYYVKYEATHKLSGVYNNPTALCEYREILSKKLVDPTFKTFICCQENKEKIVGFSCVKLIRKGDYEMNYESAKTSQVKLFFNILHQWNSMFSFNKVMSKFGIDRMYDDNGAAVHPDYRGIGIIDKFCLLRRILCKENKVPLTGAWLTSIGTQKATAKDGWENIYEISREELERILDVKFDNAPDKFVYAVWKN